MTYKDAEMYVKTLNRETFAGYGDWRLPTLPELASFLESEKLNGDLYIDPIFDKTQQSWSSMWDVVFHDGIVHWYAHDHRLNVRAVRCRQ